MLIERIARARVHDVPGLQDLVMVDGAVLGLEPSTTKRPSRPPAAWLDAGGRVVVPAFVDAHVHLDKAFLLHPAEVLDINATEPDLSAAIAVVGRLRAQLDPAIVRANAMRAVDTLVRHGTVAARVQVELDVDYGLDLVTMHQSLAAAVDRRCELQLVAFPQAGLERPGAERLLADALKEGLDVVGGCPYVDDDPRSHLDKVFGLAERYGVMVDLHLDFDDDPAGSLLNLVAERTTALGMQGRVTVGHATKTAAMQPAAQAATLDRMAAAGVALVALPATDLYLGGHGEPGTRSLAPIERAIDAGVRVAIANNNIVNPFAPYGNGNLLQAAWLCGLIRRLAEPRRRRQLLDAITCGPAEILGLAVHGPTAGSDAHLVVLDISDVDNVVLGAPSVVATLRSGRVVHRAEGAQVHPAVSP